MPATLVLLARPEDARHLAAILAGANRDLTVVTAADRSQLEAAMAGSGRVDRLIAFRTNCVVPAELLRRVSGPSYNFHPAPPAYSGRYPFTFALYDRATQYGVTAHEMVERVDAGPIVGALGFALPADPDPVWLSDQAHTALIQLFVMLAPQLAATDRPLPPARSLPGTRAAAARRKRWMRSAPCRRTSMRRRWTAASEPCAASDMKGSAPA